MPDNSKNLRGERRFITDYGQTHRMVDTTTGLPLADIPRYGVWGPVGDRYQVLESHNDLVRMQQEHGVPDARIVRIEIPPYASLTDATLAYEVASAADEHIYRVAVQRHTPARPGDYAVSEMWPGIENRVISGIGAV